MSSQCYHQIFFLYIVSTPIGNLGDFSARGAEVLSIVDCILCEDTRVTAKLLSKIGIKKKLVVYNDHTAKSVIPIVINKMKEGIVYALVSDAGTPLISDPGFKLINACTENDINYTAVPGSCAAINALVLSGFSSDKFLFGGFIEHVDPETLNLPDVTVILYVAPTKLIRTLEKFVQLFPCRRIAVIREMTKMHEEIVRGVASDLLEHFYKKTPKGEFVIVLEKIHKQDNIEIARYNDVIKTMIQFASINEVSKIISNLTTISRNIVYNYIKSMQNH